MDYKILKEKYVYEGFLKVKKAEVQYDTYGSDQPTVNTFESIERGDSVAVLMYESDTDSILFVNQFRYPSIEHTSGWMTEIIAGGIDDGESPETGARREIKEEIGYRVNQLKFISHFFVSPGGTSERIFLYYTEVTSNDKTSEGGGTNSENIKFIKIKKDEVREMLKKNEFNDAKTLIALQYFFLNK